MDELKKQAEELGIKVDGRWSEERLQSEIDKVLGGEPLTEEVEEQAEEVAQENEVEGLPTDDASTAEPEEEGEAPVTLTSLRANPIKRLGLKGFGSVELSADQLGNKQLMARIAHGVETGVLALS